MDKEKNEGVEMSDKPQDAKKKRLSGSNSISLRISSRYIQLVLWGVTVLMISGSDSTMICQCLRANQVNR